MTKSLLLAALLLCLFSCNNNSETRPETSLDTGREFIRASLDGNFKTAEQLLLKDTQNLQLFERYKSFYGSLPNEQKQRYKAAEYTINKYSDVNDSVTTINYSNSYMKKPMDIKVVRKQNLWSVDFKFTYGPQMNP